MVTSAPFDTKPQAQAREPKDLSFLDRYINEWEAREKAEQRVRDFTQIALNWCARAAEYHRDAARNRRAFVLATLISAIMTLAALVGWLK